MISPGDKRCDDRRPRIAAARSARTASRRRSARAAPAQSRDRARAGAAASSIARSPMNGGSPYSIARACRRALGRRIGRLSPAPPPARVLARPRRGIHQSRIEIFRMVNRRTHDTPPRADRLHGHRSMNCSPRSLALARLPIEKLLEQPIALGLAVGRVAAAPAPGTDRTVRACRRRRLRLPMLLEPFRQRPEICSSPAATAARLVSRHFG